MKFMDLVADTHATVHDSYSKLTPADVSNEIRGWLDGSAEVKPRWDVGPPSGPGPEPSRIG